MDYKDYERGKLDFSFWDKGKKDLLYTLLLKLKKKDIKILNLGAGIGDDLEILNQFGLSIIGIYQK